MCSPQTKALQVADVSQNSSVPVFHGGVVATPFTGAAETASAALELTAHTEHLLQKKKKILSVSIVTTLWASLSSTFPQTLPELVTP